jgi:protein-tyrosine phosphatase
MNQPPETLAGGASEAADLDDVLAHATPDRLVPLEGALNFRDLGGYRTADGRRVRRGKLFRAGSVSRLTAQDREYVTGLGIRTVFDLRTTLERTNEPNLWAEPAQITYWSRDYGTSFGDLRGMLGSGRFDTAEQARQVMIGAYQKLPFEQAPAYAELFRRLAGDEVPLIFHCSAGKDRAGTAAALILSALGVPRETVMADYLISDLVAEARQRQWASVERGETRNPIGALPPQALRVVLGAEAGFLQTAFKVIEERHGTLETYLAEELSVSPAMLQEIRSLLIE